jgi:hypothetical protein
MLGARRIAIEETDGSASLWVKGLYPFWLRRGLPARAYTRLARRWPSFFARDFIVVGRKLDVAPRAAHATADVTRSHATSSTVTRGHAE